MVKYAVASPPIVIAQLSFELLFSERLVLVATTF